MRASRLVSLLLLLQTRGRMTARELAATLEVSVRTVYRDIESLGTAGVPIYGEPGHDGGYQLLNGYRTRLTGLTSSEAESLFLTGLPSAAADLGLGGVLATAQLKLMAALPVELRDRAGRMSQRFHLDVPGWYQEAEAAPHLTAVAGAVWEQRALWMRYERWAEPAEVVRVVQPYGLVVKAGHWYLVACAAGRFRTYRVSRILNVEVRDDTFDRECDFDLAGHWQAYLERFEARRRHGVAVLRVSAAGLARLPDLVEPAIALAAEQTATEPGPDGWSEVAVPIESGKHSLSEILKLGADVEVLAPWELRERVIETVRTMTTLYRS